MHSDRKLSRRDFLKTSALATAGAALISPQRLDAQYLSAVDLYSQNISRDWEHYRGSLGGPWEVWRGAKASDHVEWQKIDLPHCFNARDAVAPGEVYYRGQGWYRTSLKLNNQFANGRTLLHFEGAGQKSRVYVGLDQVGEHIGGYDEWIVDITDAAAKALADPQNQGVVPLAIVCDNSRDLEMMPSDASDFNLYGGLYRYLNLVRVPAISIEGVHVTPTIRDNGSAEIVIRARLFNPTAATDTLSVTVAASDPSGKNIVTLVDQLSPWSEERELTRLTIPKPELWSPSHPALYYWDVDVSSTHGRAAVGGRFGVRHYEFVDHGPFKLNGERLMLRGTQRHEDHAGLGAAMTEELIRKELHMVKEMGANFIRLGHYQQSRIVLDLCDELGIMVWEEIPWCRSGIGGERWQQQAHRMLRNMIDQHYNHPAVIIWGLGNENDWPGEYPSEDHQAIRDFLKLLHDETHKLDATRVTGIRRCDFCKDIPDVYSPSIWAGWYRGRYTEYKSSILAEMPKVNHMLHIEWGGDSQARRHSEDPDKVISQISTGKGTDERGLDYLLTGGIARASRDGDWSETYICNLFDWHLKEQETIPNFAGSAQWIFKDFSTPERPENPVPKVNQKGVVERDLTPKEGYYVFQSYWSEKPTVHIYGHSWPVRWGDEGEEKLIKVYSNCETVELFVNGQSQGTKKRNSQDFPAAGLRWKVKLSAKNQVRAVGSKNGQRIEDQIEFLYQTQKWGKPAQLQLREIGRNGDLVTIEAQLLDANSVLCLDARNPIQFGIAGDGTLIADLGTDTAAREVELYNGRAIITLNRNGGKSQASVSSKSIPTTFLTIA